MSRTLLRTIFCCPCCGPVSPRRAASAYRQVDGTDHEPTLELSLTVDGSPRPAASSKGRHTGGLGSSAPADVQSFEIEIDGEEEDGEEDAFMSDLARDEIAQEEEESRIASTSAQAKQAEEQLKDYLEASAAASPSLPPYNPVASPIVIPANSARSTSNTPRTPAVVAASSNARSTRTTPKLGTPSPLQPPPAYNFPSAAAASSVGAVVAPVSPKVDAAASILTFPAATPTLLDSTSTEAPLDTSVTTADLIMSPENDEQHADILRFSKALEEAQEMEAKRRREAMGLSPPTSSFPSTASAMFSPPAIALPSSTSTSTAAAGEVARPPNVNPFTPGPTSSRTIVPKVHRGSNAKNGLIGAPATMVGETASAPSSPFVTQERKLPEAAAVASVIPSSVSSSLPTSVTSAESPPATKKQLQPSLAEQVKEQQQQSTASTASSTLTAPAPSHPHPHPIAHSPSAPALSDVAALEAFPTPAKKQNGTTNSAPAEASVAASASAPTTASKSPVKSASSSGSKSDNPLDALGVPAGVISAAHMSSLMSVLQSSTSALAATVSYAHLFAFLHGKDRSLAGSVLRPFVLPELETIVKAHAAAAGAGGGAGGKPHMKRSASVSAAGSSLGNGSASAGSSSGSTPSTPSAPPPSSTLHPEAAKLLAQFLHWLVDVRITRVPGVPRQHHMLLRFAFPGSTSPADPPKYHYIDQPSQETWVLAATWKRDPWAVHPGNQPQVYRNESNKLCLHRELLLTCDASGVLSLRSGDVSVKKSFLSINCDLRTEFRPGMVEYDDRKRAFIQMREDDDTKPVILAGRYQPRTFDYWLVVKVFGGMETWIGLPTIGQQHPPDMKMKPHEGYAYP